MPQQSKTATAPSEGFPKTNKQPHAQDRQKTKTAEQSQAKVSLYTTAIKCHFITSSNHRPTHEPLQALPITTSNQPHPQSAKQSHSPGNQTELLANKSLTTIAYVQKRAPQINEPLLVNWSFRGPRLSPQRLHGQDSCPRIPNSPFTTFDFGLSTGACPPRRNQSAAKPPTKQSQAKAPLYRSLRLLVESLLLKTFDIGPQPARLGETFDSQSTASPNKAISPKIAPNPLLSLTLQHLQPFDFSTRPPPLDHAAPTEDNATKYSQTHKQRSKLVKQLLATTILLTIALSPLAADTSAPAPTPAHTPPATKPTTNQPPNHTTISPQLTERFASLALECVHKEYPNKISHVMTSPADVGQPSELTPVFYGCFDWHSAVHGHWLLARICRLAPDTPSAEQARAALAASFTPEKVADELKYMQAEGRATFERPYGLAWLLQLTTELREWNDPDAQQWSRTLEPLETLAAQRFKQWLPKLTYPVRTGLHSQTAFALGLVHDWSKTAGDTEMSNLIEQRAKHYYLNDRGANMAFEPSGQDFLSPAIAEADLMRRILPQELFAHWLTQFLPQLRPNTPKDWLTPAIVSDRTDGHLVHLDGLNLSRAWMLEGIASHLPKDDPRQKVLKDIATTHRRAGLAAVTGETYEGGHWLGSFAVYLDTQRGINE